MKPTSPLTGYWSERRIHTGMEAAVTPVIFWRELASGRVSLPPPMLLMVMLMRSREEHVVDVPKATRVKVQKKMIKTLKKKKINK